MKRDSTHASRLFRALLRLLPFDFRSDFGPEMEIVLTSKTCAEGMWITPSTCVEKCRHADN